MFGSKFRCWLFHYHLLLISLAIIGSTEGETEKCTNYLTTPIIDDTYNQIECVDPSNEPKNCNKKTKCIPTTDGVIKINNCLPEEDSTFTKMLMSFNRSDSEERLVPADNITHLIIREYKKKCDPNCLNVELIDVSKPMFKEMSMNFPNLKGITFFQISFYGSITTKSFDGLENLERVTFEHTNVNSILKGSFDNLRNIKGISFEKNAMLHQIPSTVFSNINSLQYLRIVTTKNFSSNLFLRLENLKELSIIGEYNTMKIPNDFLHDSCRNLECIELQFVHPDLSDDIFSKCHKLKRINLQSNEFSFDRILDIENQLLSPLNNITYLKIDEKNLTCPVCQNGNETYCNCSNCRSPNSTVAKLNSLTNIAKHTDVNCYLDSRRQSKNKTLKYFVDAMEECETCKKLADKSDVITISVATGIVICILIVIIVLLSRQWVRAIIYDKIPMLFPDGEDGAVFLIHVDEDLVHFEILKDMLEGVDKKFKKHNKKYLRGRKYETLYHERDFEPGERITINIKNCVDKCRKALILLTPAFINSQWCRDEFVIAQSQEKAVFIRLKLSDEQEQELNNLLSKPENAPIKLNLETRTYLSWTGEIADKEFWRWIAYLLPHKKPESDKGNSKNIFLRLCCNFYCIYSNHRKTWDDSCTVNEPLMNPNGSSNPTVYRVCNERNSLSNPLLGTTTNIEEIRLNVISDGNTENTQTANSVATSGFISSTAEIQIEADAGMESSNPSDSPIHRDPPPSHEDQDWYHPEFKSLRDSSLAMYNRTSMEGTFMVTNIPESERSFGLYKDGNYLILRGGAMSREVTISVIRRDESGENFVVSGIDQGFPSIFELVEHFKQNNLPGIDKSLVEAFKRCSISENKRCRRCSSKDGK